MGLVSTLDFSDNFGDIGSRSFASWITFSTGGSFSELSSDSTILDGLGGIGGFSKPPPLPENKIYKYYVLVLLIPESHSV